MSGHFDYAYEPRARSTDPESSHIAAERAKRFQGSHMAQILSALDVLTTATAHEISETTGLSVVQIDRRVKTLVEAGKVRILMYAGKPLIRGGFRVMARTAA